MKDNIFSIKKLLKLATILAMLIDIPAGILTIYDHINNRNIAVSIINENRHIDNNESYEYPTDNIDKIPYNNNNNNNTYIHLSDGKMMTLGKILLLPFYNHNKLNYLKIFKNNYKVLYWLYFAVILISVFFILGLLMAIKILFGVNSIDKIKWIISLIICCILIYHFLALRGLF